MCAPSVDSMDESELRLHGLEIQQSCVRRDHSHQSRSSRKSMSSEAKAALVPGRTLPSPRKASQDW